MTRGAHNNDGHDGTSLCCPQCGYDKLRLVTTQHHRYAIRRIRECRRCGSRFYTSEHLSNLECAVDPAMTAVMAIPEFVISKRRVPISEKQYAALMAGAQRLGRAKRYNAEQQEAILQDYLDGMKVEAIAAKWKCHFTYPRKLAARRKHAPRITRRYKAPARA